MPIHHPIRFRQWLSLYDSRCTFARIYWRNKKKKTYTGGQAASGRMIFEVLGVSKVKFFEIFFLPYLYERQPFYGVTTETMRVRCQAESV